MILEDDPLTALDLSLLVQECGHDVASLCETVAEAKRQLLDPPDFALLDVDLPDGKSFDVAEALVTGQVPFAFVSASRHGDLPVPLRHAPFIAKPFAHAAVRAALGAARRDA